MKKTRLQLFAKPPLAGQVKTRLTPALSPQQAADVYRHCLQSSIALLQQSPFDYQIWLTEPSDDDLFKNQPVQYQQGPDLGARMRYALQHGLQQGFSKIILIGSDCLDIDNETLLRVSDHLQQHELVLIPALDGGYVLIAVRDQVPATLFDDIDWSTPKVLTQTLERAMHSGLDPLVMNPMRDIDQPEDLQHYPQLIQLLENRPCSTP